MNVQYLSEYLEYIEIEKGLASNTVEAYRRDLADFLDFSGRDVDDIERSDINSYILKLREKGFNPRSVMRKIASLRGFFKWLCANEKCSFSTSPEEWRRELAPGMYVWTDNSTATKINILHGMFEECNIPASELVFEFRSDQEGEDEE